MDFYIEKMILHNRAPFEHILLNFKQNCIVVLSAINGGGKTTILSHIVDAWYELAKKQFAGEFEDRVNKFYRISTPLYAVDKKLMSLAYVRFRYGEDIIDYVDLCEPCDQTQYDDAVKEIDNPIPFSLLQGHLGNSSVHKGCYKNGQNIEYNTKEIENLFNSNLVTSFPAIRYEQPNYLNDLYKVKTNYSVHSGYYGYLKNPLEIISGLPDLANWIMDLVLDRTLNRKPI